MANLNLTEITILLNEHIHIHETVSEQISQASALACSIASNHFHEDSNTEITHKCLGLLMELLQNTDKLAEGVLKKFFNIRQNLQELSEISN